MKFKFLPLAALALGCILVACKEEPQVSTGSGSTTSYVVAGTKGSEAAYVLTPASLTEGSATIVGDGYETSYASSATWVFFGNKYLYRLAYNQGQAGNTEAFHLNSDGEIEARSNKYNILNFTAYGICGNKIIATGTGATTETDKDGNAKYGINFSIIDVEKQTLQTKTISAEDFVGTKEYVMLAGLLESNGKIYASVVPLGCSPYGVAAGGVLPGNDDLVATEAGGQGGGSYEAGTLSGTQYPNYCYIAVFDDDTFENYTIISTDQMSWAAGRMRAAYYQTVWAADNGDIYVFSPSVAKLQEDERQKTTHPSSVMRIKKGATEFDSAYGTFNIEAAAEAAETEAKRGGGSGSSTSDDSKAVYRCWHITGDYFLLQMYANGINNMGTGATKMAIFKGEDKTFRYITGLPASDQISSFSVKSPYNEDGVCYIGVSVTDESPRVYQIDPETATATPGLVVDTDELGAIGKLVSTAY